MPALAKGGGEGLTDNKSRSPASRGGDREWWRGRRWPEAVCMGMAAHGRRGLLRRWCSGGDWREVARA